MRAAALGDRDAVAVLYERHHATLFSFVARWTQDHAAAEDVVHETFLRLLAPTLSYDGRGAFRTWLLRIARNLATDRHRSLRSDASLDLAESVVSATADSLDGLLIAEDHDRLERALAGLRAPDRELLLLRAMGGLNHAALASELRCTEGAARVRLHRAVHALREQWDRLEGGLRDRSR